MRMAITVQRVHIELSRVQTWLLAVPRLRAMVGANALLGETLRVALPKLARETGRGWAFAPRSETYPAADPNDPPKDHAIRRPTRVEAATRGGRVRRHA